MECVAADCYVIIVLRRGAACLVVDKADGDDPPGVARAKVATVGSLAGSLVQFGVGRSKRRRRAQKVGGCATRVGNNVLRAQKGWGTSRGDVGVGRRWGGRSSRRGRASCERPTSVSAVSHVMREWPLIGAENSCYLHHQFASIHCESRPVVCLVDIDEV